MPGISACQEVFEVCRASLPVDGCASLGFDHFRPKDCFRESRFAGTGQPGSSPAEQAARANAHIGHAACYRMRCRIEADESKSF
jgi:hypothetical protein